MELLARLAIITVVTGMMLVAGCAGTARQPGDILDPGTGVTIGHAQAPAVFYRDNSGHAAYARDYIYLGPLRINSMGEYRYYLWLGAWSTHGHGIDGPSRRDALESLTIIADGEPLPLEVSGWTPQAIGSSVHVYDKPVASAVEAYYRVTLDQIRLLAEADDIRIFPGPGDASSYELWNGGRRNMASMRQFVDSSF